MSNTKGRPFLPPYTWKGERRAGYRWRLLARKDDTDRLQVACRRCGFKGQSDKHPKRCDGTWDELVVGSKVELHSTDFAEPVCFDELVLDDWFHIEQMSDRHWWMRIGPLNLDVLVRADGRREISGWVDDEGAEDLRLPPTQPRRGSAAKETPSVKTGGGE